MHVDVAGSNYTFPLPRQVQWVMPLRDMQEQAGKHLLNIVFQTCLYDFFHCTHRTRYCVCIDWWLFHAIMLWGGLLMTQCLPGREWLGPNELANDFRTTRQLRHLGERACYQLAKLLFTDNKFVSLTLITYLHSTLYWLHLTRSPLPVCSTWSFCSCCSWFSSPLPARAWPSMRSSSNSLPSRAGRRCPRRCVNMYRILSPVVASMPPAPMCPMPMSRAAIW